MSKVIGSEVNKGDHAPGCRGSSHFPVASQLPNFPKVASSQLPPTVPKVPYLSLNMAEQDEGRAFFTQQRALLIQDIAAVRTLPVLSLAPSPHA